MCMISFHLVISHSLLFYICLDLHSFSLFLPLAFWFHPWWDPEAQHQTPLELTPLELHFEVGKRDYIIQMCTYLCIYVSLYCPYLLSLSARTQGSPSTLPALTPLV